jgi:hypothetical protein
MGILTDVFIATEAELAATPFEGSAIPRDFFPRVPGKNLDMVMLALLEAVVTEQTLEVDALARMDDEPLRGDESSEAWIYALSERLVARLAELTPAEITRYGTQWAAVVYQEWLGQKGKTLDSSANAAAIQYLQELCQLALQARAQGKHMYLWVCL